MSFRTRTPRSTPPAWAELKRVAVDSSMCEGVGRAGADPCVAAPVELAAAAQELEQQASLGRRETGLICQTEFPEHRSAVCEHPRVQPLGWPSVASLLKWSGPRTPASTSLR